MGNKVGARRVNERWDLREQGLRCSRQQKEEEIDPRKFLKVVEIVILTLSKQARPHVQKYRHSVMTKQDKQNPFSPLDSVTHSVGHRPNGAINILRKLVVYSI